MCMRSVLPAVLFLLGSFAGLPGKPDYLENFRLGSWHHNTEISTSRVGLIVMSLIFVAFN